MSYRIDTPATIFDMAELGGAISQLQWAVAKEMWAGGETFAMRSGERLLGVFGLYPTDYGAEAWFNIRPEAAPHMLRLIRDIRLTLASRTYPEIVAICATEAGRRIACACGFALFMDDEGVTYGRYVRRGQQGSAAAAETGSGGATAPDIGRPRQTAG